MACLAGGHFLRADRLRCLRVDHNTGAQIDKVVGSVCVEAGATLARNPSGLGVERFQVFRDPVIDLMLVIGDLLWRNG